LDFGWDLDEVMCDLSTFLPAGKAGYLQAVIWLVIDKGKYF